MEEKDIAQALEIDHEAFPTQWPHPSYTSFKQELRNRLAHYILISEPREIESPAPNTERKTFRQRVLQLFRSDHSSSFENQTRHSEYVIGIAGFWIMVDEAHITTIAVRNAYRRQGVGERLLIEIVELAGKLKANVVTLEVRASNKQAQELYKKYGFQKVGIRRGYYTDNGEDAVLMTTDPLPSSTFQSHFQQLKQGHMHRWRKLYSGEPSKAA